MALALLPSTILAFSLLSYFPSKRDSSVVSEAYLTKQKTLRLFSCALVVLPVFLQAPWVHFYPLSALLFTFVLLGLGLCLAELCDDRWFQVGSLLIGVSGSWLGGCMFWGWLRMHPVLHLPVEAVAMPLAFIGLSTKWRIGASFYLSCLLGTALTDFMMLVTGVMDFWPDILAAPIEDASFALNQIALNLLTLPKLLLLSIAAIFILFLSNQMSQRGTLNSPSGSAWVVAGAALTTTLWVDGLFLLSTLIQPKLSGLI